MKYSVVPHAALRCLLLKHWVRKCVVAQVLLSVYARSGQTQKALEVLEVMQRMGMRVELSFVTWLLTAMLQVSGTIISRHNRAEDYRDVLTIWKVLLCCCELSLLLVMSSR